MCRCCEVVTARTTQVATETVAEAVDAGIPTAVVAVTAVIILLNIVIIVVWFFIRRRCDHLLQ